MSEIIVAFQGDHGANSEEAARRHFGKEVKTLPCESFEDLFEAIAKQQATHGMLPVENSLAGTVASAYELLMDYDYRVQGEYVLPIHYYLMAPPGTDIEQITHVKSHPQALAQCSRYLRRRGWKPVVSYDTAGAARELHENPEPNMAALAPPLAAELYGMDVLDKNVEDEQNNSTRFFIINLDDAPHDPAKKCKTSVVFTFRDRPGMLVKCLNVFAERDINMSKIESRPVRERPWQYWFFVDFDGHWEDDHVESALVELLRLASFVKMLGSYPITNGEHRPK